MQPLIKSLILLILLLAFLFQWPSGHGRSLGDAEKIRDPVHEAVVETKTRELVSLDGTGDYNEGGANCRHDQNKKGKGPGDGGNSKCP